MSNLSVGLVANNVPFTQKFCFMKDRQTVCRLHRNNVVTFWFNDVELRRKMQNITRRWEGYDFDDNCSNFNLLHTSCLDTKWIAKFWAKKIKQCRSKFQSERANHSQVILQMYLQKLLYCIIFELSLIKHRTIGTFAYSRLITFLFKQLPKLELHNTACQHFVEPLDVCWKW